jgi:hypothetical protein
MYGILNENCARRIQFCNLDKIRRPTHFFLILKRPDSDVAPRINSSIKCIF